MGINVNNVQSFQYSVELYNETQITISSSSNPVGYIRQDDNSNLIGTEYHGGSNYIYEGIKTISGNIIIYDDVNFSYIDGSFTSDDIDKHFLIKPNKAVRYFINANKDISGTTSGDKITIDLTNKLPFKVFLNGTEIKSDQYTYDSTGITLISPYDALISEIEDDVIVYTYGGSQEITSGSLLLKYEAPQTLLPLLSDLQDGTYFDTYGNGICAFDAYDVQVNKNNNIINNIYQYISPDRQVNRDSKLNISIYDDRRYEDLRLLIKDQVRFRILAWDEINEELYIYSNCMWKTGEGRNVSRTRIDTNFNIDFEDELKIQYLGDPIAYGTGLYGVGTYGGVNLLASNYRV